MNNIKFDWNDISLVPSTFSDIKSRKEIDILTDNNTLPLFIAPMDTVIDVNNISKFLHMGFEVCVPRGVENSYNAAFTSFGLDEIEKIVENGGILPKRVLIDIANGHSIRLYEVSKKIKNKYDVELMVGNIANSNTYAEYAKIGVDYIRCGIGGGCFVTHAKVVTRKGLITLNDIKLGDYVLTHQNRFRKVLEKHFFTKKETFLKINNLPPCTQTHEIYCVFKNTIENTPEYVFVEACFLDSECHKLVYNNNGIIEYVDIHSIEEVEYDGIVIDLTIADDESYNIEGFIVHNSACTTSANSATHMPYGSLIQECAKIKEENNYTTKIIADGGFKSYKDIIMALAVGADYVMLGGIPNKSVDACGKSYILSNDTYIEIPNSEATEYFNEGGDVFRLYRGMSTKAVQKSWGRTGSDLRTSEGITKYNKIEYTMSGWVENFSDYLKSAMSYSNKRKLNDFIGNVEYVFITQNAYERFNK